MRSIRELGGVVLKDWYRYRRALARSGQRFSSVEDGWISLCNRNERLLAQAPRGYACDWQHGSSLHAPGVLPSLGRKLMDKAFSEWPISFGPERKAPSTAPEISFVFAHAGGERLAQLRLVLASVMAQRGVQCECIVVDQSDRPDRGQFPEGLTYRFLDKSTVAPGWHKSWGFNVGAKLARSDVLVFHDGDICMPEAYALEVLRVLGGGRFGAASLQRFLFYLDEASSAAICARAAVPAGITPVDIRQNWKGGSIAVRRDAFAAIGGFDEGFVDWGGEDDEFFDRCAAISHARGGYLPFLHLWHLPQAGRKSNENLNICEVLPRRLALRREARIAELLQRRRGDESGPDPAVSYAERVGQDAGPINSDASSRDAWRG
jgi:hypothetical protein